MTNFAKLLFISCISMADDEGRLRWVSGYILGEVFPFGGASSGQISRAMKEIEKTGMIKAYSVSAGRFAYIVNWHKHQRIDKPQPSLLPAPNDSENDSRNDSENISENESQIESHNHSTPEKEREKERDTSTRNSSSPEFKLSSSRFTDNVTLLGAEDAASEPVSPPGKGKPRPPGGADDVLRVRGGLRTCPHCGGKADLVEEGLVCLDSNTLVGQCRLPVAVRGGA